jgi:hypothetical protein
MVRYATPKDTHIIMYGLGHKAGITCYQRSKWEVTHVSRGYVQLCRKEVWIQISNEDFKEHWKELKND